MKINYVWYQHKYLCTYLTPLLLLCGVLDKMEESEGDESFFTTGGADLGDESNGDLGGSKVKDPTECRKGEGFSACFFRTDLKATSGDATEEKTDGFSEMGELGDFTMLWRQGIPGTASSMEQSEFLLELQVLEWIDEQPLLTCSSMERIRDFTDWLCDLGSERLSLKWDSSLPTELNILPLSSAEDSMDLGVPSVLLWSLSLSTSSINFLFSSVRMRHFSL